MFEVGKKYRHQNGVILECLFLGGKKGLFRVVDNTSCPKFYDLDDEHEILLSASEFYTEFRPPVVHTRYVHWYKQIDPDEIFTVTDFSETASEIQFASHVLTLEVTYTEE